MEEQRLGGGRSTTVSRVGDTVRRATGRWTPTVHAYLRHLRAAGFTGAPEVLGIDEQGREILRFIEGTTMGDTVDPAEPITEVVTVRPWPATIRSDRALAGVGRMLRDMHTASCDFRPEAPVWREHDAPMAPDEVVTQGDAGPWNVVYRGEDPVAFIDWDKSRPQRPLLDLAAAAWNFVPLGSDDHVRKSGFVTPFRPGNRLRLFADAYGVTDLDALLDALSEVKQRWPGKLRWWQPLSLTAAAQLLRSCADDLEWLDENREYLAGQLMRTSA